MGEPVFRAGERFAGYEIVGLLGAGGFAEVYEVVARGGERRALKTLATEAGLEPTLRARFGQEGAVLTMIEHPNVVRLFEAGFHEGRMFLVLELVRGRTLRDELVAAGGPLDQVALIGWIIEACEGVSAAHDAGVIHRDIKPENLILGEGGHVKVIDFGVAKLSDMGLKTTADQKMGTALYMAPELLFKAPPDARTDVYAMGLVLYEALAGAHPMTVGPTNMALVCYRQVSHVPPPLASIAPAVPADLSALVDRAIDKDPARRFPTMRALIEALRAVTPASSVDASTLPHGAPSEALSDAATPLLGVPPMRRGPGGTDPLPPAVVQQARAYTAARQAEEAAASGPILEAPTPLLVRAPATPARVVGRATNTTGGRVAVMPPPPRGAAAIEARSPPVPLARAPRAPRRVRIAVLAAAAILGLVTGGWIAERSVSAVRARTPVSTPR